MNIPIVFSFDKRIILGAAVAIKSLISNAKPNTIYSIKILHSDIELKFQKRLSALVENTQHSMSFHYINPKIFKDAPHNKKSWTELVYYRLLIPELFQEYDKVIYCDVDVLFMGDLQEAYCIDLQGYEMAAVPVEENKKDSMICHKYFPENTNKHIYISSFLVMNCKLMREENTVKKFHSVIKTIGNRLKFFDLDTLNIACDRFLPLPFNYGVFYSITHFDNIEYASEYKFLTSIYSKKQLEEAKQNPIFIHYAGKLGKPWRMKKNKVPLNYKKYMDNLPENLKIYTFRDIRKRLFGKP